MNFKNRYLFLFSVLAMVLFVACKEDPDPSFFEPELSVMPAENMHRTGATISGTIHAQNNSVVEKFGIEYSEYENFSVTHEVVANTSPSEELFTVHLTDLAAGTAYYYRAFAFSGYSTAYSNPLAFSTPKMSAPVFGATVVNDVSYTSASFQSSITDSGGEEFIMSAYFYKQVESEDDVDLTFSTEGVQQISCDTTYVMQVKNLESGKMYAARPYGITAAGLGYGDIVYFTTPETQKMLVSTVVLGNEIVDEGCMEVSASVLSEGSYPIAEYGFCYSATNTMPDEDDMVVKVNHVGTEFSGKLKNLLSQTTYYVRAYARNNQGEIAYSEEAVEFTTSKYNKSIAVEMIGFDRPDVNDSSKVVLCGLYDSYVELREVGFVLNDTTKVVARTNVLPGNATYHYDFELEYEKPYVVSAYILTENSEYYYATKRVNIDVMATPLPKYSMNVQVASVKHNAAVFTGNLEQVNSHLKDEVSVTYGVCVGQKGSTPTKENCLFHLSDVAVLNATNRTMNWTIPLSEGLSPTTEYSYVAYYTDYYGNIVYTQVAEFTTAKPPMYNMNVQVVDIKHTSVVFTGTLQQVNANFEDEVSVTYGVCVGQKGSTPTKESCLFHLSDVAVLNATNRAKNWTIPLIDGLSQSTEYSYVAYYIDYYGKLVYTQVAEFTTAKLSEILFYTVNGVSFNMKGVEGGTFQMGATPEQTGAETDEKPVHSVTLSDYYIGETEVTQELWMAVMGTNPSSFTGNIQRPVEQVSWDGCQTFISKLNELTGENFRLPTEAEWEYAARGGNQSKGYLYSGSNSLGEVAWYSGNSGDKTHAVKTKSPNELGLYDMSGNVWEWCQDWYGYYSSAAETNPTGPASGTRRVIRGGSWNRSATGCRAAGRYRNTPGIRLNYLGVRLAL